MKTILTTGASGLIGSNFLRILSLRKKENSILGYTDLDQMERYVFPTHSQLDITNKKQIEYYFKKYKPDSVLNFAAYRDATSAELEHGDKKGLVWVSNVAGVKNISDICLHTGAHLIHISTDMVFSGKIKDPGPYSEDHPTEENLENLSWYGWTKRMGEQEIMKSGVRYSIIRIGNVTVPIFDPRKDYVGKIIWLYKSNGLYPLFSNQKITISTVTSLTTVIKKLIKDNLQGIYHVGSVNLVSPYELAKYMIPKIGGDIHSVMACSIDYYLKEFPNRYPKYGGLRNEITRRTLNIEFDTWNTIADNFLEHLSKINKNED